MKANTTAGWRVATMARRDILRVAYSNFPPFVIDKGDGAKSLDGFMPEIVERVAKWMNIELQFIREAHDIYGNWENNTWTGMIGMLYRNEVDLIMNPILPRVELLDFAFYTNPVSIGAYTMLSGIKTQEAGLFFFFSVLNLEVWISVLLSMFLIAIVSATLLKIATTLHHIAWINLFGEFCWIMLCYMLGQQPSDKWLRRSQGLTFLVPFLLILWMLGIGLLVMNVFQSLLMSKLTFKKSHPLIDTMEDIANVKQVTCLVPENVQLGEFLEESGISSYERAWQRLKHNKVPPTTLFTPETLLQVHRGKACVIHGHNVMKGILSKVYKETGTCSFYLSKNHFFPFPLPITIQKSLPLSLLDKFNLGITRLVDADISGKWMTPALRDSELCRRYKDNTLKPLSIENIYSTLIFWCLGQFAALVCLLCEIIHPKWKAIVKKSTSEKHLSAT